MLLALLIAGILLIAAEGALRIPALAAALPAPGLGSTHDQFEVQIVGLRRFAAGGPVDCIFLGSSMVRHGLKPEIVTNIYAAQIDATQSDNRQSGETLRCYTFGVLGLTADGARALADYLITTYQPRLLVYGLSPRDFSQPLDERADLNQLDWLRYMNGTFTLSGWLHEHARTVQYGWLLDVNRLDKRQSLMDEMAENGYTPNDRALGQINIENELARITTLYQTYAPVQEAAASVAAISAFHAPPTTQIVLVEMPVYPPVVFRLFGADTYQTFNADIVRFTAPAGVIYWPTTLHNLVPQRGWADLNHLNEEGATIFSTWLGQQLAAAVLRGDLQPLARRAE